MKIIVVLYAVIISCRLFAQFKPYDPNDPNPSYVDVFNARRLANEERWNAFNAADISIEAQQHRWNAMEAERDARDLEDRMHMNEQRRRKEDERCREEEEQHRRKEEERRVGEEGRSRFSPTR